MKSKPKIVILGAGFGDIYTFLGLRRRFKKDEVEITIINQAITDTVRDLFDLAWEESKRLDKNK